MMMSKHLSDLIFLISSTRNQGYSEQFLGPFAAFLIQPILRLLRSDLLNLHSYWLYHHIENTKHSIRKILKVHERPLFNFKYLSVIKRSE